MPAKPIINTSQDDESALLRSVENPNAPNTENLTRDRILVLIGGVCIHLVLGTFYLWGTISLYVASYLRSFDDTINISMISGVFPFAALGLNIGLLFGLNLAERFGFRLVLFISMTLMTISVFCTSFITSYIGFVLLYGIFVGICSGCMYIIPVVCGWKYFPNRKGLVSGLTVGAFGFGSFIFNFVALRLVNPDNLNPTLPYEGSKYFDDRVYEHVPKMFKVLAGCYLVLGMVGVFALRVPRVNKKVIDVQESDTSREQLIPAAEQVGCKSLKEGLMSIQFVLLTSIACFGAFFGLMMTANYKVYGLIQIPDDDFITLVGSLGSVSNGCTRAVWAMLFDRFGFKIVYSILIIIQIILAPTLSLVSSSKALYLIWYMLIMSCEGGHFSLLPSVTAKVFGLKFGPKIYSFVFWGFATANFLSFFIVKYTQADIGWKSIFYIGLGLSCVALTANVLFKERFRSKSSLTISA